MSSIDYSEKIPNNVNLSEDRALQRALEHWQPNYLSWWQDMGPDGSQNFDVYLRTAVSVDPQGWAQFGHVKMPDYRWGIFLNPAEQDRKIHFGDHMGEAAWQDVPGEHRANLRRIIVTQGDTEPASVEQQRHLGLTAPSQYDLRNLFQVNVEEGRHLWAMVYLLHAYFGRDGREEADARLGMENLLVARRQRDRQQPDQRNQRDQRERRIADSRLSTLDCRMKGFPQLHTEDVEQLETLLKDFVTRSGVRAALIVESAGYLIHHVGELPGEPREFASLASNAFNAAQAMSRQLRENFFTQLRVTGTTFQTLIWQVDESCLLVVVYPADMDSKKVEEGTLLPVINLHELLKIARTRSPGATVDLASEDAESFTKFFRRTPPPAAG